MRTDGRQPDEKRPVKIDIDFVRTAYGSCLIATGNTRVICTASVEETVPPFLKGQGKGWITAEYAMLPASTGERKKRDGIKKDGRSVEIQRLIGRALRQAVDLEKLGERTITLDCDVLEADGGTRTASITGAMVALTCAADRLVREKKLLVSPVIHQVAAVSAASKLSMFFACVFDALASTMATFAGQNVGARKLDRVGQGLKAASILGTVYCVIAWGVVMLFGDRLLGLFIDGGENAAVLELGFRYLRIQATFYIPLLFVNIVRLSIQGMGFTRVAMVAGLCEMVARVSVALLMVPSAGFTGASFANPAAWVLADLFLFPCYFQLMRVMRERLMPELAAKESD